MNSLKISILFAVALLAIGPLCAQSKVQPEGNNGSWRITGYVLTTSPVTLSSLVSSGSLTSLPPVPGQTVWLCGGDVNAAAGTAATVTIKDGNSGVFWTAVAPLSTTAASSYSIPLGSGTGSSGCRPFPAGLLVSASAGSTITFAGWGYN
jgi:hypothetical protein